MSPWSSGPTRGPIGRVHYATSMPARFTAEIETRAPGDGEVHRTIIWVVVEGNEVFIRSVRGSDARWYREVTAAGEGVLIVGDGRIPFRAVAAAVSRSARPASP